MGKILNHMTTKLKEIKIMSDYTRIRRVIQGAKHLTDAERDELVKLIKGGIA